MTVALIIDGAVARYADTPDSDGMWLPVTDCRVRDGDGPPVVTLHATGVTRAWGLAPADVLPGKIALVKAEAARRIETIAPLWRQQNMQAEATEILLRALRGGAAPEDADRETAIRAFRARILAIRQASDAIEAALAELAASPGVTAAEIASYDIERHPLWPDV